MQKIILASGSPRRKALMKAMGLDFDVVVSNFDEYLDDSKSTSEIAKELALGKAQAVSDKFPDHVVVGSDSIVVIDGKQLGKPESPEEAVAMLTSLRGKNQQVITGVALVCKNKQIKDVRFAATDIFLGDVSDAEIAQYVATGDPYDKAGGYTIQHPILAKHFSYDRAQFFNIVGFPVWLVIDMLKDQGINVPNSLEQTKANYLATSNDEVKILT